MLCRLLALPAWLAALRRTQGRLQASVPGGCGWRIAILPSGFPVLLRFSHVTMLSDEGVPVLTTQGG